MADILPTLAPALREVVARILATGQPVLDHEFTGETALAPGVLRSWNESWYPVHDERGEIIGFGAVVEEITARRQTQEALRKAHHLLGDRATHLESLVEERTKELRDTNGELESFSYSMAHDLRGPLRAMQGFANILRDDFAEQLDPTGKDYVARIGGAAERMARLVADVLTYSTASRQPLPLSTVTLQPLLQDIIEQYPSLKGARIRIAGVLPSVLGNEGVLTQVISNLLTNAVKFVPAGRAPEIDVSVTSDDSWVTLSVRDNGTGIAPEHHERIFRMFERVHSSEKYEGTGIGLAIVRRSVERLGGSLGVESADGQGSRFWVKLKRAGVLL